MHERVFFTKPNDSECSVDIAIFYNKTHLIIYLQTLFQTLHIFYSTILCLNNTTNESITES